MVLFVGTSSFHKKSRLSLSIQRKDASSLSPHLSLFPSFSMRNHESCDSIILQNHWLSHGVVVVAAAVPLYLFSTLSSTTEEILRSRHGRESFSLFPPSQSQSSSVYLHTQHTYAFGDVANAPIFPSSESDHGNERERECINCKRSRRAPYPIERAEPPPPRPLHKIQRASKAANWKNFFLSVFQQPKLTSLAG